MIALAQLARREWIGLLLAGTLVLAAVLDRVAVTPLVGGFAELETEITQEEKALRTAFRNVQQKELVSEAYQRYVAYIKQAGSDEETAARMLAEIEGLARNADLHLADVKPREPRMLGHAKWFEVEVQADGSMESLIRFLHDLNRSSQLLRARTLVITPREEGERPLRATMGITHVLIP
ncbi:MAG: GspMb/PilO family protein [Planctomycetota bacterium]